MKSLIEWLNQPWVGDCSLEDAPQIPENPARFQVYAAMISIGGRPGSGYGVISGGGLYGRTGLHQEEAFTYIQLSAFVNGWLTGTDGIEAEAVSLLLKTEWERVKSLTPNSGVVASP